MSDSTSPGSGAAFATTRWTVVLHARGNSPEAQAALGELCESYWGPVFSFIRRSSQSDDAARDLTQEFFSRMLARQGIDTVEPGRGRFRSFLLGAVRHFLADMRDHDDAAKRGGGCEVLSLDAVEREETDSAQRCAATPVDPRCPLPDSWFDREWAVHLVNRAVDQLAAEQTSEGRRESFSVLKPWLLGEVDNLTQAEAAARLGWTENAVRVAIHRLRRRFRELVKLEITQTVIEPSLVGEELRYLVTVLATN